MSKALEALRTYLQGREQNEAEKRKAEREARGGEHALPTRFAWTRALGELLAATEAFAIAEEVLQREPNPCDVLQAELQRMEAHGNCEPAFVDGFRHAVTLLTK